METPVFEFGLLALLDKVGLRGLANHTSANGLHLPAASWSSDSLSSSSAGLFTPSPLNNATSSSSLIQTSSSSSDEWTNSDSAELFHDQKTTQSYTHMNKVDVEAIPWPSEMVEVVGRLSRLRRVGVVPVETIKAAGTNNTATRSNSCRHTTRLSEEEIYETHYGHSMLTVTLIEEHDDEYYDLMFGDQATARDTVTSPALGHGQASPLGYGGNDADIEDDGDNSEEDMIEVQYGHSMLTVALIEEHDDEYYNVRFGDLAMACCSTTPSARIQASHLGYSGNDADIEDEGDD